MDEASRKADWPCVIRVKALRVSLPLGWGEEERRRPQPVRFDLWLGLPAAPPATISDELRDTIDYHTICSVITTAAQRSRVRLLERLAEATLEAVRPLLPAGTRVRLRVTKESPPIPALAAASVTLSETIGRA